jgi:hypothetical protein
MYNITLRCVCIIVIAVSSSVAQFLKKNIKDNMFALIFSTTFA